MKREIHQRICVAEALETRTLFSHNFVGDPVILPEAAKDSISARGGQAIDESGSRPPEHTAAHTRKLIIIWY